MVTVACLRYCRFFQGRRTADDRRQIQRWLKCCGPKGRWKSNLCGKVVVAGASYDDPSVSPVVRQTLLHWAYELTAPDFDAVAKRIRKGSGATYVPRQQIEDALRREGRDGKKAKGKSGS